MTNPSFKSDATWRYVQFSLIFPLPERSAVIADGGQDTSATGDEPGQLAWKPGRWQNANKVRKNDEPYGQRVIYRNDGKSITSNGWPPERRFGTALSSAASGQPISDDSEGGKWYETLTDHYHLEISPSAHDNNIHGTEPMPTIYGKRPKRAGLPKTRFPVTKGKPIDDDGRNSVQLQAIEVLNYFEPRDSAIADRERTETTFLVLHVCVQDCSGAQLRQISRSLSTHRHGVVDDFTDKFSGNESLVQHFVYVAKALMERAASTVVAGPRWTCDFSLQYNGQLKRESDRKTQENSEFQPRPFRIAVAIPEDLPPQTPTTRSSSDSGAWSPNEWWAWQIATGADPFYEGHPEQTRDSLDRYKLAGLQNWTFLCMDRGVGIVRNQFQTAVDLTDRVGDTQYLIFGATRYVDLAILTLRNSIVLHKLHNRLTSLEPDLATKHANSDDSLNENEELRKQVDALASVERSFLTFRDKGWFTSVPGRRVDTELLLAIRNVNGGNLVYNDFVDELAFRQQVYNTQYQYRQLVSSDDRTKRSDRTNKVLGVVAAALGGPGIAEAFGLFDLPHIWSGIATVGVCVFVWLLVSVSLRWIEKR